MVKGFSLVDVLSVLLTCLKDLFDKPSCILSLTIFNGVVKTELGKG